MRYAVILAACVGGCALPAAQLREQGQRVEFKSAYAAPDVAICMAHYSDRAFPAHVRNGARPDSYEVVARDRIGGAIVLLADVEARDGGSHITTWLKAGFLHRDLQERVVEPCGGHRITPAM